MFFKRFSPYGHVKAILLGFFLKKKKKKAVSLACIHESVSALLRNLENNILPNFHNIYRRAVKWFLLTFVLKERREHNRIPHEANKTITINSRSSNMKWTKNKNKLEINWDDMRDLDA